MKKRITIYDVAEKAGVSPATVNRALNDKTRVSEETKRIIKRIAKEMGYKPSRTAKSLARKQIRLGVVSLKTVGDFHLGIIEGAKAACEELADFNVTADYFVSTVPNFREEMLDKIRQMAEEGYDGILVSPCSDIRGFSKVISEVSDKGIAVATVVSDIPDSKTVFSVRSNGRVSGRIACQLLGWQVPNGEVAIFTGSREVVNHSESISGFMEEVANPGMEVVGIYENQDDPDIAYFATEKLLRDYPNLKGLYINTSNSETVCKKIIEKDMAQKIRVVASDIFPELVDFMKKGVIHASIYQNQYGQAKKAFMNLYEYIAEGKRFEKDIYTIPQIITRTNVDLYLV
jgi:LacI family transcriptional regulator